MDTITTTIRSDIKKDIVARNWTFSDLLLLGYETRIKGINNKEELSKIERKIEEIIEENSKMNGKIFEHREIIQELQKRLSFVEGITKGLIKT